MKLTCILRIFINFLIHIFILSRLAVFLSLAIILVLCVFVIILRVSCLFFTNSSGCNLSLGSAVFRVYIILTKMLTAFKVIITTL